jgi:hypothetical protein
MGASWKLSAACTLPIVVAACASFEVIQDPRFGALSKDRLPGLIKSLRCELATFYTANEFHRERLSQVRRELAQRKQPYLPLETLLAMNYFDLDTEAYGLFTLDIKAQDTLGVPGTATSITNVLNATTGHTRSIGIGPSAQVQATYDNGIAFVIQQNSSIKTGRELEPDQAVGEPIRPALTEAEAFPCFRTSVRTDYDGMAAGAYSNLEQFNRIRVDVGQPLAAWLQENTRTAGISRNLMLDIHADTEKRKPVPVEAVYREQSIDAGQLGFTFTVQYTGGIDAKFSLISSRFNPFIADVSAGLQQTGTLTIFLNGYQAQSTVGAKGGIVAIEAKVPGPTKVIIVGYEIKTPKLAKTDQDAITEKANSLHQEEHKTDLPADQRRALSTVLSGTLSSKAIADTISNLSLNENAKTAIKDEIESRKKTAPSVPTVVEQPSTTTRTLRENNGRGVLRYPLGFPIQ